MNRPALVLAAVLVASPTLAATRGKAKPAKPAPVVAVQKGKASWYGGWHAGRPQANGRPFDPRKRSMASRTLPLGTIARVRNLKNGKTIELKVTDRGPYVGGRIADLSERAMEDLGGKQAGVVPVEIVALRREARR